MRRRTEMPGSIRKEPDGTYSVRVATHLNGEYLSRKKRNLRTKWEADAKLREFQEWLILEKANAGIVTWEEALNEYIEHITRIAASPNSHSTIYDKKTALLAYTGSWFEIPVHEFYGEMIEVRLADAFVESGIESQTKNKITGYVREVFAHQVYKGILEKNPALGVHFEKGRKARKPLEAMTRSEIALFLKSAVEMGHRWEPIWRVAYLTGARNGELCELRVGDVCLESEIVTISRSWCNKAKAVGPTKSGESRVIPIQGKRIEYFKTLVQGRRQDDFLLPQFKEMRRGESARHIRTFQKELGIRETNFHSLRASFITHLALANMPSWAIQTVAGHSDIRTTERYVRMVAADLKGLTSSLDAIFEGYDFSGRERPALQLPLVEI